MSWLRSADMLDEGTLGPLKTLSEHREGSSLQYLGNRHGPLLATRYPADANHRLAVIEVPSGKRLFELNSDQPVSGFQRRATSQRLRPALS